MTPPSASQGRNADQTSVQLPTRRSRLWNYALSNLNFYRIHLLLFCIIPVVMAAIMFASNGEIPVSYGEI